MKKTEVCVYSVSVNFWGEINSSLMVASFYNMNWFNMVKKQFIKHTKDYLNACFLVVSNDDGKQYRICNGRMEEVKGTK